MKLRSTSSVLAAQGRLYLSRRPSPFVKRWRNTFTTARVASFGPSIPTVTPIDVDFIVSPTGTLAAAVTTGVLDASMLGTLPSAWAWSLVGTTQHTTLAAGFTESVPTPWRIPSGATYTTASRVLLWDLAAGIAGGGTLYAGAKYSTASNYLSSDATFAGLIKFTASAGAGAAVTYEWMTTEGTDGNYASAQFNKPTSGGGNGTFRVEIGNGTNRGKDITVQSLTDVYYWCLRYNKTSGKGELCLVDLTTRKIVGVSEYLITLPALADFQVRDYALTANGVGYHTLGEYAVALGVNAVFPLALNITVDAPTAAASTQTGVSEITATWTSTCARFKVEFSTNAGSSWSTATSSTLITGSTNSYIHSSLTDGLTYTYRITALVGDTLISSTSSASTGTLVNNSAFPKASDNFDSLSGGNPLNGQSSWVCATNDFLVLAGANKVVQCYSVATRKAAYWNATWAANQRTEVQIGATADPAYDLSIGGAVRVDAGLANWYEVVLVYVGGATKLQLRRTNTGASTKIGSDLSVTLTASDWFSIDVTGTGGAIALKVQKNVGGAGWVDVITGVSPGGTAIDSGRPGLGGFSKFGADSTITLTYWKGYEI